MKKLSGLISGIAIIISVLFAQSVSAKNIVSNEDRIRFLETLGVMENIAPSSYSAEVTRESFAYYAAKAAGIRTTGNDSSRKYIDVPTYSFAFSAINNLADAGIISQTEDGRFRPNDSITYAEACTIMLNVLGYKEYASFYGDWPQGYLEIARILDIKILNVGDVITIEQAAELIYEAIKSPIYEIGISSGKIAYTKSDETLLSKVYSIEFAKGTFEAFDGGTIETSDLTKGNKVKISGEVYEVNEGLDISTYFGDYVEYFYYDEDAGHKVVHMHRAQGTEESVVIDIENYVKYSGNTISYYVEKDSSRTRKVTLSQNHTIVYNGMPLLTNVEATMADLNEGTITVKDSDNDGSYDLAVITDYKNFVVRSYDEKEELIYDKVRAGNKLELDDVNYIKLTSQGEDIPRSSLIADVVLSVAKSQGGEIVTMLACGDHISGTVQEIGNDHITIDGIKYEIDGSYKDYISVEAGGIYVFHLNSFGKVGYVSASSDRRMKYAYLMSGYTKDDEESYFAKLFTEDGEMVSLEFANKVTIDGNRKKNMSEICSALSDPQTGTVKPQLVEFELNSDGMIKEMDTSSVKNENEDKEYSLMPVFGDVKPEAHWWGQSGRYMYKALINTQVITFMIPDVPNAGNKYYRIAKNWKEATMDSSNEWWEDIDMYWRNDDSAFVDVIVKATSTTVEEDRKNVVMVTKVYEAMDDEDDIVVEIKGIDSAGSVVTLQSPPEKCDTGISKGDLVVVSKYKTGDVAGAKLVYDASEGGEPVGFITTSYPGFGEFLLLSSGGQPGNYRHETQISFGYAKKVFNEDVVSMSRYMGGDETERMIFPNSAAVYDANINEVYVGSIADVMSYEDGLTDCSKLFYHTHNGVTDGVFVYK